MNILLIDEGSAGAAILAQRLRSAGFRTEVVNSAAAVLDHPMCGSITALLIDQGPGAPFAMGAILALRQAGLQQPLIVLSARDDWRERVASFDAGADDFLVKPVHSEEVTARLRAGIRRAIGMSTDRATLGDLDIDLKAQCAWHNGQSLDLTRNEFRLLRLFLQAPDGVVTKDDVVVAMWDGRTRMSINAVEVLVGRLRTKLGPDMVRTVRGMGYRFTTSREAQ